MNLVNNKQAKKKLEREEEKLKSQNRDLSFTKMKSMALTGVIFTLLLSTFNNWFSGRVVAKLPFIPIGFIQGLSHRNLPGEDLTDCSFIFLYVLCTMSIRQASIFKRAASLHNFRNSHHNSHQNSHKNSHHNFLFPNKTEPPKASRFCSISSCPAAGSKHFPAVV